MSTGEVSEVALGQEELGVLSQTADVQEMNDSSVFFVT